MITITIFECSYSGEAYDGAVIAATNENLQNTALAAAYNGMVATDIGKQTWDQYARNDQKDVYITLSDKHTDTGGQTINQDLSIENAQSNAIVSIAQFEVFGKADFSASKNKKVALISLNSSQFSQNAEGMNQVVQAETLNHELSAHVKTKDEQRARKEVNNADANHKVYGTDASFINTSDIRENTTVGQFLTQIINSDKIKLSKETKKYIKDLIKKEDDGDK